MEDNEILGSDALNMLKHFPLLLPSNNFKCWEGIVYVRGIEVVFSISTPHYPSVKDIQIKYPPGFQSAVNNILKQVLPGATTSDMNMTSINRTVIDYSWFYRYNSIFKELQYIGIDNVIKTDATLSTISLKQVDNNGYEHILDIKLPNNYPNCKPLLEYADLPDVVLPQLTECCNICEIFRKFCSVISSLQNFWSVYESLREKAWVIDPEYPKKRDTYSRIVIGENVSVLVSINPAEVSSFPEIKFLGADKAVAPFRKTLEDNLQLFGWDINRSLVDNLLTILGFDEFPLPVSPSSSQKKNTRSSQDDLLVDDQECSICFMLRAQDNMLPTKICNNDKCTSVFHLLCLAQWFQSVPTNEPTFNVISGDCPHCGKRILCPISLLQ
ncbi:E3 ubiquitin-protein ligase FANCL-like isoform X2 [Lycorma delicatula]|uniref:E3 ubiquitin-protein ligase FANCL-like isoform X2 n=1 Tax=Lycorma delicatula TaxID=130591 RepID=UPI003F5185A1